MGNTFVAYENVFPMLAPVDIAGTAQATPYMDLKAAQDVMLYVYVGGITTASADQTAGPVITIEAATGGASASNEVNVEFDYRLSAATGTNTWAAIASASAGLDLTVTGDGKMVAIHIDPSKVAEALADARFVRAVITPGTGGATCLVSAWAAITPRYRMTTMVSAAT
jgi:hypothetical protein